MHPAETNASNDPPPGTDAEGPAAIRASEAMFRALFDLASVAMAQADLRTMRLCSVNRKFCEILEYSSEELIGLEVSKFTHPDDREADAFRFKQIAAGHLPMESWEKRYIRRDGTLAWVRVNMTLVRNQSGEPERTLVIVEDIHEHKVTEEALSVSRTRLEAAFANMTDAVFISDTSGRFIEFNDAFATFHRFGSKAECRRTLEEYPSSFEVFLPNGMMLPTERWPVSRSLLGETATNQELTIRRKDTGENWIGSYSYSPIRGNDGEVTGSVVVARDVTEEKRALEARNVSEQRYSDLFRHMNEGLAYCQMIYEGDKPVDFRYIAVNERFGELTGLHDVVGRTFSEILPNIRQTDPTIFDLYGRVARGGVPEKIERFNVSLQKWFDLSIYSVGNDRFVTVFDVITARKEAEAALRKSESQLKAIFNGINDAAIFTDPERRILMVNPAFTALFGYAPKEVIGRTSQLLYADERNYFALGEEVYHDPSGVVSDRRELRYRRKDGSEFWAESTGSRVVESTGGLTGFVGIHRDVTARRGIEEAIRERTAFFEAEIESAPDAVLVVDKAEHKVLQNRRLNELFNFPAEILADSASASAHAFVAALTKRPEEHLGRIREIYGKQDLVGRDEIELADGRIIDRYSAPVRDKSGNYYGRIWTMRDITEKRLLEKQFLRAQRLEAVGTLSSGIAHDLNNILAPLLLATGMIRDSLTDPKERELMQLIETSARRGAGIVRQLLTFSRGIEGERVPIQMRHLVKEMATIAQETFPRNIRVIENGARDLLPVMADATQIHQVLMNLCLNARDAMPEGGELRISARNVRLEEGDSRLRAPAGPGLYILVAISDTGHGIPAEIRDRIFEPFYTTKGIGKGTGLGLSTGLGIVRSHGGFLTVDSEVGHGTTFSIFLPVAPDGAETVPVAPKDAARGPSRGETILVVDDEPAILVAIRHCLEENGYRVFTAKDGKDAIAVFVENQHDIRVVVTDTMMPVMDGTKLAMALHAIDPRVRVISSSGLETAARSRLVSEFLNKPYENSDLIGAVRRQLEKYVP